MSDGAALRVEPHRGDAAQWDAFVRSIAGASIFHLHGWKDVLHDSFGFAPHYLTARRGAAIAGVLPLFEVRAPLMPRRLMSLPFAVEGGVCGGDAEAQAALAAAALGLAAGRGAAVVELRDGRQGVGFTLADGDMWRFRRALYSDEAANFAALPAKRRNMIRRAQRHGLRAGIAGADLPAFHDLYARTARRFGTPVFPLRYFAAILARFPDETMLLTVRHGGTPVAGALAFLFGGTVCPYYVGSRRDAFRYAVNDFLYWELMREAAARGARTFDFGRSRTGSGAFTFKRLWGFEPEPLRYRVAVPGAGAAPTSGRSRAVDALRSAWRRLPLPITKLLGPFFVARYGPYFT